MKPNMKQNMKQNNTNDCDVILLQTNDVWMYSPSEHLGMAYLAASLRKNDLKVIIIDAALEKLNFNELYLRLNAIKTRVLGVTMTSFGYTKTTKFLEFYKEKHSDVKIVTGGHFATFAAEKIRNHTNVYDEIIKGEGEFSFVKYCKQLLQNRETISCKCKSERITNLDSIEFPARDYLPLALKKGAATSVLSSRGCYAICNFCSVHNFYKHNGMNWISRSIPNIIQELEYLYNCFSINEFMFVDDNFMGPGKLGTKRASEFAKRYIESNLPMKFSIDCRASDINYETFLDLKKAGLTSVFMGIESVDNDDLKLYQKKLQSKNIENALSILKNLDIKYTLSLILFNPFTTRKSLLNNIDFLNRIQYYPRNPILILNIYEGTNFCMSNHIDKEGPFWDYRFTFQNNYIEDIYQESLSFFKETLPFERSLNVLIPNTKINSIYNKLFKLRLSSLKDLTVNINKSPPKKIINKWRQELSNLIELSKRNI